MAETLEWAARLLMGDGFGLFVVWTESEMWMSNRVEITWTLDFQESNLSSCGESVGF